MRARPVRSGWLGRYLLAGGLMLALVLISQAPPLTGPRAALRGGLTPLESATAAVEETLSALAAYLGDISRLNAENRDLQGKNGRLRAQVAELQAAERENAELRRALDFERAYGHRMLAAQVVGRGPDVFSRTLSLDRGSGDGIRPGMVVVTGSGLVGRVREASAHSASVQTVADPSLRVNAYTVRSGLEGTVGGGSGPLRMELQSKADAVAQPGEWVLTSGIGGGFPRGIPVGQVLRVSGHASAVTELADLAWANDLGSINLVLVITDFTPR